MWNHSQPELFLCALCNEIRLPVVLHHSPQYESHLFFQRPKTTADATLCFVVSLARLQCSPFHTNQNQTNKFQIGSLSKFHFSCHAPWERKWFPGSDIPMQWSQIWLLGLPDLRDLDHCVRDSKARVQTRKGVLCCENPDCRLWARRIRGGVEGWGGRRR